MTVPPLIGAVLLHAPALPVPAQDTSATRVLEREVSVGLGWLDDAQFRYGRYTGLVSSGLEPWMEFRISSRPTWDSADTAYWSAEGTRLGQDARRLEVRAAQSGRQRLTLGLTQIPRYTSDSARTPYEDVGSTHLTLPAGWAATGNTTPDLPALGTSLADVNLRERRTRFTLGYERELDSRWHFTADYRHDRKQGRRTLGGTTGSTGGNARAALLPTPIDFTTETVDLAVNRTGNRTSTSLAYTGSFFRNAHSSISWQTAFGQHPQWADGSGYPDGSGRLALEPDNSYHQLGLTAAHAVSDNARVNFGLAVGRMIQDQALLAYSLNPRLEMTEPLPRSSLAGRVDLTRADIGFSARPASRLQVNASYRYEDRDDRTPREAWRLIRSDSENQRGAELARINRPYSLREHRLHGNAGYRLSRSIRVQGSYRYTNQRRDFSEIDRSQEHHYSAGLRLRTLDILTLSVDLVHARRSVGEYIGNRPLIETRVPGTVGEDEFENHPLLRKYYLADRDRDGLRARADIPIGSRGSVGLSGATNRDDYRNSVFGLNRATMRTATVDGTLYAAEDLQLTAFYTRDRYDNQQAGRSFNATAAQALDPDRNWWVNGRDRFNTIGASVSIERLGHRWDWLARRSGGRAIPAGFDAVHSTSRGAIDVSSAAALVTADLPDLTTRLRFYRLHVSYPLRNEAFLRLSLEHERYRSRDFAYDQVAPGTIANVMDLGHQSPNYSVNWVVLNLTTRF